MLKWVSRRHHLQAPFLGFSSAVAFRKSQFLQRPAAILYQLAVLVQEKLLAQISFMFLKVIHRDSEFAKSTYFSLLVFFYSFKPKISNKGSQQNVF